MFAPETKILVVDDFATMRKIVRKVLSELGYKNVQEADDGNSAWPMIQSSLQTEPFQLVISDWNMPVMKGIDLLRNCRKDEKAKGLPFLMVTAETEQQNIVEAVQAGASDYVVKPFNAATLKAKLENVYNRTQKKAA